MPALAPGEGLLVYAGTGSIAVHVSADGALHRAGGYGYRIDDAGGGYWLGRAALQAMLRDLDRRGNFLRNPFTTDLLGHIGHDDWPGIKRWAYGADRAPIASLARIVLAHAGGDPLARQLVHDAAAELIALAGRLRSRTGVTTWVTSGGLLAADNELRRALQAGAPADVTLRFHVPDFASAALTRAAGALA